MANTPIQHATLVFDHIVPAPVEQVFAVYADANLRAQWGAPSDTAVLIYDAADFLMQR